MDDANGPDKLRHVRRNSGENTRLHFAQHTGFGENADTGWKGNCVFDRFDVIEFHRDVHRNATLTQRLINGLTDAKTSIERSKLLSFNVSKRNQFPFRERVRAVAHKHHGLGMPGYNRQRSMRRWK